MIKKDLPMAEYRAMAGLSKHELDNFAVAPSYYIHRKGQEWKPSRSMELGTLIHSLVLENRIDYAVGPNVDKRTKDGKAEWAGFCYENVGKTIITQDEETVILGCKAACEPLLEKVKYDASGIENSMFWERSGIQCKGRPDLIGEVNGELAIVDLKTTNDIRSFDSKFFAFRYDVQAAWYQRGLRESIGSGVEAAFWFLVVDTEAPHLCQLMKASTGLLKQANDRINEELEHFIACVESDIWPGLPEFKVILPRTW